jgi:hypothetical protein
LTAAVAAAPAAALPPRAQRMSGRRWVHCLVFVLLQRRGGDERDRQRIVGTSYPSFSTGGAQRAAPSGRGNDPISRRTRGSGGNTSRGCHNRSSASKFRRGNEIRQVIIRLIDVNGDTRTVRRQGRMNTTNHSSVLDALSARASRFDRSRRGDMDNARPIWYLFMGPGHSQNFGNGLWVESALIVSRTVSHCIGSYKRTYVEYTVGMSVRQQGRNS